MLRAGTNTSKGPLILAGLSEGNVERLKAGFPIKADLRSFGVDVPGVLTICYGRTEQDIVAELEAAGIEFGHKIVDPLVDQHAESRARHKHILIGTVGLPKSGKSTWARSQAYPVVSPDSIRLAMHGQRYALEAEPHVWAVAKTMVQALFLAGHRHVILDATNGTKKRRDEWKSEKWQVFWHHVNTSREECERRARAEDDAEILPVIDRMAGSWEPLGPDELWW